MKAVFLVLIAVVSVSHQKNVPGLIKKINKFLGFDKNARYLYDVNEISENQLSSRMEQLERNMECFRTKFDLKDHCMECQRLGENYLFVEGQSASSLAHCYYVETTEMTFQDAANNCANKFEDIFGFGILFEPRDEETNDKVIEQARNFDIDHRIWIGIHHDDSVNHWKYHSSDENLMWTNWDCGKVCQPSGGIDEDCGLAWNASNYAWHDGPCSKSYPSICQITPFVI